MSLYDINPLDDEEERKRREAIAARMDEEAYANPVGPVNPSFLDTAGQYLGNRFDAVMDRVSGAGDAIMNPQAALQQRMANEQQEEAANTEVKTQTVKTYGDGSQERVVKTQIPAGQAQQQAPQQAPMAGMMGPVAPNSPEAQQQAQQFAQAMAQAQQQRPAIAENMVAKAEAQQPQPQQRPMGAVAPANYSLATGQGQPGIRVPQMAPQAGQVAAAPGASLAQMGANAQAQARPVVAQTTPFTPTAEREVEQPKPWVQAANDAGTDFYKLLDVASKHPESRDMISDKIKSSFKQQTMRDDADAIMKAAQAGDLKAMNKIQQAIRPETGKPREEVTINDYLKAVLYKRLGLDAMAADVQAKIIGKETKFGQVTFNGTNWETETDPSGRIVRAKDNEGNIATESTLNQLRAGSQKFGAQAYGFTGESAVIPQGQPDAGQEYRQRTNSMSGAIENVITSGPNAGKIYSGPPGAAKSVGTSYSKALNQAFIDFQSKPTIEMAKKMMEIAGQVDDGSGNTINAVNNRIRQMTPDIFGQITSGQAGTPPAPTGVGGTNATPDQVAAAQRNIASIQRELARPKPAGFSQASEDQRRAILQDELAKNQAIAGSTAAPAQGATGGSAVGGSLAGRLKAETEAAGEIGTDLGKIKANQPKAEANADYLLTKINELITHPGFSVSVGATVQPGFQFIPGTDKASWYQRFEEVKGQSFLQGIENLRGMGALSNQEGEAATKAVQRMSTSSSEAEFKAAAKDFNEVIQRGIDRNRVKLGQPPLYGTKPASEIAKETPAETKPARLSPQDKQAIEWARQNPNDPRSAQIKQRLGL